MKEKLEEINNKLNKLVTHKNMLIGMIVLTIIFLIPILWVSFYTVPSADDFSYGEFTMNILQSKGIWAVLKGAIDTVVYFYRTWQGTYSATLLFSLNPAVISKDAYFLTTFVILDVYFIGLYFVLKQVLKKGLQLEHNSFWIILLVFFLLCIETMVDKNQGLFWWNGSIYYILFFSLELLEIALLVKEYWLEETSTKNKVFILLLNLFVAGGNFIVALQQIIILVFLNIYLIFKKKDKSAIPYLVVSILGLAISGLAPGNKVREAKVTGMNPIKAIILSFYFCFKFITQWTNPVNMIIMVCIEILLYRTYHKSNFKFSYPLIVMIGLFCLLSAEFTPSLYAMSIPGEGRLWNIIYFSYLFVVGISFYYLVGYIRYHFIKEKIVSTNSYEKMMTFFKKNAFLWTFSIFVIIFLTIYYARYSLTSYQSLALLTSNQAKIYKEEWNERYKILEDESIKDVEFQELTYYPYPIHNLDFVEDKDSWINEHATNIYHKDSIILFRKEEENEKDNE